MAKNGYHKILIANMNSEEIRSMKAIFDKDTVILSTRSADIAVELAWTKKPDMIIVSTQLVDLTGWEVLGILKKNDPTRKIPFIMLDGTGSSEDEAKALNLGADDYINRPLDPGVFLARIKAVLRRSPDTSRLKESEETLESGNILMNMTTHTVEIKRAQILLTPKEFALLYLFMKNIDRVLKRDFLSSTIWEREYYYTNHTIDRHIANLRKKLGPEGKRIETLHGIGYKLCGDTEEENYN